MILVAFQYGFCGPILLLRLNKLGSFFLCDTEVLLTELVEESRETFLWEMVNPTAEFQTIGSRVFDLTLVDVT